MTMGVNMLINKKTMSSGKSTGIFCKSTDDYEIEIEYSYYWDDGDYDTQPSCDLEMEKARLNDMDISDFFYDYLVDTFESEVLEYAQDNQYE